MLGRKPTMVRGKRASTHRTIVTRTGTGPSPAAAAAAIAAFSSAGSRRAEHKSATSAGSRRTNPVTFAPNGPRRGVSSTRRTDRKNVRHQQQKQQQQQHQRGRPSLYDALLQLKAQEDEKTLYHGEWAQDLSLDHPNYGSIFLQIKEANSEADGSYEFIRKTGDIISNTLFVTVILGMLLVLPVGMISIGVKHLNDCPKEDKIPIYLLVGGCFGFLKLLSLLWKQVRSRRYERLDEIYEPDEDNGDVIMSKSSRFSEALLSAFLFIWFICGNYWVFGIWRPNFKQLLHEPSNWCDKTVYMFAVIQIMIGYSIMGLIVLLMLILSICHRYTADKS